MPHVEKPGTISVSHDFVYAFKDAVTRFERALSFLEQKILEVQKNENKTPEDLKLTLEIEKLRLQTAVVEKETEGIRRLNIRQHEAQQQNIEENEELDEESSFTQASNTNHDSGIIQSEQVIQESEESNDESSLTQTRDTNQDSETFQSEQVKH
ncbi:hypothetical protein QAD02_002696 [Eretmocerus hayati]|uniref:Uncharacterized protein n=1 Tax=Eretmocerus hayati TaxID=131215 RepID=A0ACC2NK20_9HYME|nr:hypothetical protein QAD02_002696 [Eretmocerus hayati]